MVKRGIEIRRLVEDFASERDGLKAVLSPSLRSLFSFEFDMESSSSKSYWSSVPSNLLVT
jgi:hypothetical protein